MVQTVATKVTKVTTPSITAPSAPSVPAPVSKYGAGKCIRCGKPLYGQAAGAIGKTCAQHAAPSAICTYKQAPVGVNCATNPLYTTLVLLCNLANNNGISVGTAVNLAGGNGGFGTVAAGYQVYLQGKRKYMLATCIPLFIKQFGCKVTSTARNGRK